MKKIFLVLSVIILLAVAYLVILNINSYADINYLQSNISKTINISIYTLSILLAGIFTGAGTVYMFLSVQKEKVKIYQRELEKTAISGTNNASRVEVLEAKIKTLEKAFNTVIDERTKLELQIQSLNTEIDKMNKKD